MGLKEYNMIKDIKETPLALKAVTKEINEIERLGDVGKTFKKVFFIGCGSSYYAALYGAWPLLKNDGILTYSLPSSELLFHYMKNVDEKSLVVGVSRSGNTAETITVLEKCKRNGAHTIGFTIEKGSKIFDTTDETIAFEIGEEKSIIMTKSFTSFSLATALFSTILNEKLFGIKQRFLEESKSIPSLSENILRDEDKIIPLSNRLVAENVERFVFLGSGPSYPIALEGALKIKETSYVATEGLHLLEFRHGPMASIGEKQSLVIACFLEENHVYLKNFVTEFMDKHADIILVTDSKDFGENVIRVPSEYSVESKALLSIIPIQILAYYYSVGKGKNPDRPRNLFRYIQRF
ncbi:MAG: SIS domain-containing protein [Nitrososphaeria archaeon]|nr:SIS domain-containing protein [Nitrososphaeria archaeon]